MKGHNLILKKKREKSKSVSKLGYCTQPKSVIHNPGLPIHDSWCCPPDGSQDTTQQRLKKKKKTVQNIFHKPIYLGVKEGARLSGKRGTMHQVLELS